MSWRPTEHRGGDNPHYSDFTRLLPSGSEKAKDMKATASRSIVLLIPDPTKPVQKDTVFVKANGQSYMVSSSPKEHTIEVLSYVGAEGHRHEQKTTIAYLPTQEKHVGLVFGKNIEITSTVFSEESLQNTAEAVLRYTNSTYINLQPQTTVSAENQKDAEAVISQMEIALQVADAVAGLRQTLKNDQEITLTGLVHEDEEKIPQRESRIVDADPHPREREISLREGLSHTTHDLIPASRKDPALFLQPIELQISKALTDMAIQTLADPKYNPFQFSGSGLSPEDPLRIDLGLTTDSLKRAKEIAGEDGVCFFGFHDIFFAYDAKEKLVLGLNPKNFYERDETKLRKFGEEGWKNHWTLHFNTDTKQYETRDQQTGVWSPVKDGIKAIIGHTIDKYCWPLKDAQEQMNELNTPSGDSARTEIQNLTLTNALAKFAQDQAAYEQSLVAENRLPRTGFEKFLFLWESVGRVLTEKAFEEGSRQATQEAAATIIPILVAAKLAKLHPSGRSNQEAILQNHDILRMANTARHDFTGLILYAEFISTVKELLDTNPLFVESLRGIVDMEKNPNMDSNASLVSNMMLEEIMNVLTRQMVIWHEQGKGVTGIDIVRNTNDPKTLF